MSEITAEQVAAAGIVLAPNQNPDGTFKAPVAPAGDTSPPAADRPDWLPEKFTDGAALAKAYAELSAKLGQGAKPALQAPGTETQAATEAAPEAPVQEAAEAAEKTGEAAAQAAGLNFAEVKAEYAQTGGKLSDATMKALNDAGFTADDVSAYVEGQKAIGDRIRADIFSVTNGEDGFKALAQWAFDNPDIVPDAEINALNTIMAGRDVGAAKLALAGLQAKMQAADGVPSVLVRGQGKGSMQVGFGSQQEAANAMRDPRYATDPAYQAEVYAKIAASTY